VFIFLLLEKISNRKMALQIERNRENKEQLISFVFGFNLPVTIFYILHHQDYQFALICLPRPLSLQLSGLSLQHLCLSVVLFLH
jgi:hypothetical protein